LDNSKVMSHRCEGSLANETPIRFSSMEYNWWLCQIEYDWETGYNDVYINQICKIEYCPFCGELLTN